LWCGDSTAIPVKLGSNSYRQKFGTGIGKGPILLIYEQTSPKLASKIYKSTTKFIKPNFKNLHDSIDKIYTIRNANYSNAARH